MSAWVLVCVAASTLRVHVLRSTLTMLGIVIGVAAVIAMVSVGSGAQAKVAEQIQSLGSNLLVVLSGSINMGGVRLGYGSQHTITEDDARAIAAEIPGVQVVSAVWRATNIQVVHGSVNWSTYILGVTPDYFEARDWPPERGRALDQEDIDGWAKVALAGQTAARQLFGDTDPIGQVIRIKSVPLTIVGVLSRKGQTSLGQDQDDAIVVPLSTAKRRILGVSHANAQAVHSIPVKIRPNFPLEEAEHQLRALLRQRHRLQPHQDDDFWIRNLTDVAYRQQQSDRVMTYLLGAIASVSLVVGGIGIMNIMLVSVTERTREIGIRMAVGARRRDILGQFLAEAGFLASLGGVLGIGCGVAASRAITSLVAWRTVVSPESVVLAFGSAFVVGMTFGFYPAHKASRLNPIDALRYE